MACVGEVDRQRAREPGAAAAAGGRGGDAARGGLQAPHADHARPPPQRPSTPSGESRAQPARYARSSDRPLSQIEANHERKKRLNVLRERLQQIDARCDALRGNKAAAAAQSIEVAKEVAVARGRREEAAAALEAVNEGRGELPMVLGRGLVKVAGEAGRPGESYDMIRHELVFREIEAQVRVSPAASFFSAVPDPFF